jgi:UDP-glucose 4-epimerase
VVDGALSRQVRRLVFFSTIAVYGDSGGRILTEDSPTHPETFYAQTKRDAEKVVLAARHRDGRPLGVVLRLGAVYGSRIRGNYRRLMLSLARRRFIPIGSGRNRRTLVYDRDVARACLLALSHPDVPGGIFNVTDGQTPAMKQIIGTLCMALGRREPRLTLSAGLVRGMAAGIDNGSRLLGMRSLSLRATVDKYCEDVAVDGGRFCRTTGFVPKYDLLSGWKETVAEMKHAGEL